ncbi:hypothetical protein [Acinetobacter apis]|uniref:Uncharacterized protein n=1 Tax=Acinetobacter apis TaxID=1229165 RepID=A0A217EHX8_9GAMM|nr:hypothetical protein [Acinetobacter apis]SNQ29922.1 hypothetical protein SAMN05444584_1896 [Acinetobacter apis]
MKTIKQALFLSSLMVAPVIAFAEAPTEPFTTSVGSVKAALGPQQALATSKGNSITIISPRTGISYTLGNTEGRSIVLQTDAIAEANSITAKRIVAVNPAVSETSQLAAEKALIGMTPQQ